MLVLGTGARLCQLRAAAAFFPLGITQVNDAKVYAWFLGPDLGGKALFQI